MKHLRLTVATVAISFGVTSNLGAARTGKPTAKPNIIVVFTDDQGWADLSCQKSVADIRTPHIDRLASEGVRLTSGYVTAPQCVPSRAGLLTGLYQERFGVDHNGRGPLPLNVRTLPERLQEAGYVTGMVGKWNLEPTYICSEWVAGNLPKSVPAGPSLRIPPEVMAPYLPGRRGFSEFFNGYFSEYTGNFDLDGASLLPDGQPVRTGMYRIDAQSRAALAFIHRNKDRPFFLYLAYFAPHVPLEATDIYLKRFAGDMPERRRYALAMMSAIDDGVGRILDTLQTSGIDQNTLVVFLSDNGAPLKLDKEDLPVKVGGAVWDGSLNDPWLGEKGMLTEGGIRVPFLVRWKGVLPEGKVYDQPVISLDVAATALAVAGQSAVRDLDGVNLIPYLNGAKKGSPHESLYWRFWGQAAIRSGKWKYLYLAGGDQYLFDLSTERHEKENLIGREPVVAEDLRSRLSKWADEMKRSGLPRGALNVEEIPWYEYHLHRKPPD